MTLSFLIILTLLATCCSVSSPHTPHGALATDSNSRILWKDHLNISSHIEKGSMEGIFPVGKSSTLNETSSTCPNTLPERVDSHVQLLYSDHLPKVFKVYTFKGYGISFIKPVTKLYSVGFGVKLPITANFPVSYSLQPHHAFKFIPLILSYSLGV